MARRALIGALAAVLTVLGGCGEGGPATDERPRVRFGLALQESSALAIIAAENDYFAAEGLDCSVKEYVSGKRAVSGMLNGEVDAASTAQVPVVIQGFQPGDFRILASIGSVTGTEKVVARRDRGIESPPDLRGKRIGTQRGSAVHFFLHLFLLKAGISESQVVMEFMRAEDLPQALGEGTIDAFCMREPYVGRAVKLLGEEAVVFESPGLYYRTELLVATVDVAAKRPLVARGLVRTMLRAAEFADAYPEHTVGLLASKLGAPRDAIAERWSGFRTSVGLDQALLNSMESQAEWAIKAGLVEAQELPNYLELIDLRAMEAAKPEAVTIIR
jgi:NitT/TauT family transport system substrate-binding protein